MSRLSRRDALQYFGVGAIGTLLGGRFNAPENAAPTFGLKQSACRWCYDKIELEALCISAKEIGLESIELTGPTDWPLLKKHGLTCAMGFSQPDGFGITNGFNRLENHATLIPWYEKLIVEAHNNGISSVICFSGNRGKISDEQGLANCIVGLRKIMGIAERVNVTVQMELLNSKIDHADYQCDHTDWGVALVKGVGSDRFKLLYDIYHMQIMEGDIIRTIRDAAPYIGHYHTGGVPGRHEINETQELYYPAIMKAIAETGYKGYIGQEFIPTRVDLMASLREGVEICR
jgi:hydroxypyruvate isomerase